MLFGVVALALGGAVAAELAAPGAAPVGAAPMPGRVPVAAAVPGEVGRVDGWVGTILARPLFSPSRRPAATAAAPGPGGLPRLAGVIVGPEGKTVIFAAGEGAPILAHEGGQVGAYRVQSIGAGEVTVRGPEGVRVLRPAFASTDIGAAPPKPPVLGRAPLDKVPSVFSTTHLPFTPLPGAEAPQGSTAKAPP